MNDSSEPLYPISTVDGVVPSSSGHEARRPRVLVGMSGGVDSSVAVWLLKEQGYEVVGVTMKVWPQDCMSRAEDKCCGPQAIADARGVAHALGVAHYVVDEAEAFERQVIDYFTAEYQAGRTPNPCVMCNEKVKFGNLWTKAKAIGAEYIATGHYAIVDHHPGRSVLRKGKDPRKDQSYFLFSLRQEQLSRSLFPLGGMEKHEIRAIARKLGLKTADKVDSQEICFVPGNDYKAFLKSHLGDVQFQSGGIFDKAGNRLADHDGIEMFTIGQRKGLGIATGEPQFVLRIDAKTKRVVVGPRSSLGSSRVNVSGINWLGDLPQPASFRALVKLRSTREPAPALVEMDGTKAVVMPDEPQEAVAPGQACVFYDPDQGSRVLGGGWID
jgi:tRNA-specific 2-thiouridylase